MSIYVNSGDVSPISFNEEYEDRNITSENVDLILESLLGSNVVACDVIETDERSLEYKKRLDYLISSLVSTHVYNEEVQELIRVFLMYLDERIYQKILSLSQLQFEDDWFVEVLYDQFCRHIVNENFVKLSIQDKKKIYKIGKFISNLKGTKVSLDSILGLLNQTTLSNSQGKFVFENVLDYVNESESNLDIDEDPNPKLFIAPLTYGFESKQLFNNLDDVLEPIHPIGFRYSITFKELYDKIETIPTPNISNKFNDVYPFKYNGYYPRTAINTFYDNRTWKTPLTFKPLLDKYVDNTVEIEPTIPIVETYNINPISRDYLGNVTYPYKYNGIYDNTGINIKNEESETYKSKYNMIGLLQDYVDNTVEIEPSTPIVETYSVTVTEMSFYSQPAYPYKRNGIYNNTGINTLSGDANLREIKNIPLLVA